MITFITTIWQGILHFSSDLQQKIEEFVINQTEKEDLETISRKKMLLNYIYLLTVYFISILLFSFDLTLKRWVLYLFIPCCQLLTLSLSKSNFVLAYFLVYAIMGLHFNACNDLGSLKIIGIAFVSHQHFLFTIRSDILRRCLSVSNFLSFAALVHEFAKNTTCTFEPYTQTFEIEKYLLVLLYLPNYLCSSSSCCRIKKNKKPKQEMKESQAILEQTKLSENVDASFPKISELEKEIQALRNEIQARELFLASFSHEIRNSLNALLGNIELFKLEILNDKWLKQLDVFKVIGEVMLDQINDVLEMAKINAKKLELNYTPEDFLKVIERMWKISIIRIKQKGLRAELYISNSFPRYVEIDPHRLTQVLLNLIGNATKFTTEGFVKIILTWYENRSIDTLKNPNQEFLRLVENAGHKSDPHIPLESYSQTESDSSNNLRVQDQPDLLSTIECLNSPYTLNLRAEIEKRRFSPRVMSQMLASNSIFVSSDNERSLSKMNTKYTYKPKTKGILKIEVIDTGCGMSRPSMQKLFQPFTQADASVSKKFGGTGLGLYITKSIIDAMNGKIQVYSQQNVGSNFCALLPIQTADEEDYFQRQLVNLQNRTDNNKTFESMKGLVLNTSQIQDHITALTTYFQSLNITLEVATDPFEALRIYQSKSSTYYTFMIIDIADLNLCKSIRKIEVELQRKSEVPILVLSPDVCSDKDRKIYLDPKGEYRIADVFKTPILVDNLKLFVDTLMKKRMANSIKSKDKLPKVLVVDDDPFNTMIVQNYIKKHNIECTVCSSGKEAVSRTYKEKFDIILMDLEMPGMDGFTASQLIRKQYPDVLILGMTGHQREKVLQKAKEHGMNNIETKPLDFKKLMIYILEAIH